MKHKKEVNKEENPKVETGTTDNVAEKQEKTAETAVEEKAPVEDPQVKINELNDKLLRLYSEFDNYRKRTLKEKIELSKTASEELIVDLLPVMDDFERAIKSFETVDQPEAIKEGTILIFNKFRNVLTAKGLQEIPALGEAFDTDHQEAVAHIPAPSEDLKNRVVDQIQKGYKLNDKIIRYAKVVVGS